MKNRKDEPIVVVCPYFWVSGRNYCKAESETKPTIVKWVHQEKYCVSSNHVRCDVFLRVKGRKRPKR